MINDGFIAVRTVFEIVTQCAIIFALLGCMIPILFLFFTKKKKEKPDNSDALLIKKLDILLTDNIVDKTDKLIDDHIKNAAGIFQVMDLAQQNMEYIDSKEQEKMEKYIFGSVLKNMTPETISLLKVTHVLNSYDDVKDLISIRVKLFMLNFTTEFNSLIDDTIK